MGCARPRAQQCSHIKLAGITRKPICPRGLLWPRTATLRVFSRGQNGQVRLKSIQLREAGDNPARSDCAGWRDHDQICKTQIESCVASAASLIRKPRIFKARDRIEHAPSRARLDASSCKALRGASGEGALGSRPLSFAVELPSER